MRLRLFWKILFGFWVTFVCIVEGVWVLFTLYNLPNREAERMRFVQRQAETHLGSAAMAFSMGGETGLRHLLESWPTTERPHLTWQISSRLTPKDTAGTPPATPHPAPPQKANEKNRTRFASRTVDLPDGSVLHLRYNTSGLLPAPPRHGPLNIPMEMAVLGVLGGLFFSALLAWYLTTPIWRLRSGFAQLTRGKLDVRLKQLMGRRRDEIADLARDFDIMAERMQSLVESREQMLYDVSHELRSPLARQHMAIGLARQNPQRTASLLDRIEQESSRMDELVGELLTLSRVEFGENVLEEYFDLQSLVRVVANNARFEAEVDGVGIELCMDPEDERTGASTIRGDAELIRRALENVLRNAIRHSPRGSSVSVTVHTDDNARNCMLQVSDSGPGVPQESLNKIFQPFVRLRSSHSHGAGLGLAIAKRAIAVHGGSIHAVNREQGGLCITIVLPLEPAE